MSSLSTLAFLVLAAVGSIGAIMAVLGVLWASGKSRCSQGPKFKASPLSKTDLAQ